MPESTKKSTFLLRVLFSRCERKYLKDNKDNELLLASEICMNSCPWTLSVPQSPQLPKSNSLLGTDKILEQLSMHSLPKVVY